MTSLAHLHLVPVWELYGVRQIDYARWSPPAP
jgi:hypothetical protein